MKRRSPKPRISCNEVLKYVCDDIEMAADSPACRKIRAHLAECPKCSSYLRSLRKTVKLYRTYRVRTPSNLHESVMNSLRRSVLSR
jgi:hypothetical protein